MRDACDVCAAIAALLVLVGNLCLTWKVGRGLKLPIVTWILWLIVLPPIAITGVLHDGWDAVSAAGITDAFGVCITISTMLVTGNWRWDYLGTPEQKERQRFIDRLCLRIAVVMMILWFATGGHVVVNVALQLVLLIAYWPMVRDSRGQPVWFWSLFLVSSGFGLYPAYRAYVAGKYLLAGFALRSTLCVLTMFVLSLVEYRRRQRELHSK